VRPSPLIERAIALPGALPTAHFRLICAGKAATSMASAFARLRGPDIRDALIVGRNDHSIDGSSALGSFNCMQDQRLTGNGQQHFPRQADGRVPRRNNCDDFFWGILSVLLHGILGYRDSPEIARKDVSLH